MKKSVLSLALMFVLSGLLFVACNDGKGGENEGDNKDTMAQNEPTEAPTPEEPTMAEANTIVDVAMNKDQFSMLVAALQQAELVEALKADGPFTVFAPNDEAFTAAQETVDKLLKDENKAQLQDVLKYHVVKGKIMSGDLNPGEQKVETLQGQEIIITVTEDGKVMLDGAEDGAEVVMPDVEADNGVIHVINKVIKPAAG